jgi:hypothetical protein
MPDHVSQGPIAVIVLGMAGAPRAAHLLLLFLSQCSPAAVVPFSMFAGSGKTTFMQQLLVQASCASKRSYTINLDPAVGPLPFACNIDIRDTVKYKEVMKHYRWHPSPRCSLNATPQKTKRNPPA